MATTQSGPPPGSWNGWPWDFSKFPHDDYGPPMNYGIWMLTTLATGFLALRIYCKHLRHRGLWWDDYFLIASWVCLVFPSPAVFLRDSVRTDDPPLLCVCRSPLSRRRR